MRFVDCPGPEPFFFLVNQHGYEPYLELRRQPGPLSIDLWYISFGIRLKNTSEFLPVNSLEYAAV